MQKDLKLSSFIFAYDYIKNIIVLCKVNINCMISLIIKISTIVQYYL